MPELRLREVHLPEVHLPELQLPEMSREDIVRAVGDLRRGADLGRLDPRRLELPSIDIPTVDLPKVDLSKVDVPRAMATAAQAAGLVRAARRLRMPFFIGGLITLVIVGIAVANSPLVRPRLAELGRRARERLDERRAAQIGDVTVEPKPEIGGDAPVAIPIEAAAFADPDRAEATAPGTDEVSEPREAVRH